MRYIEYPLKFKSKVATQNDSQKLTLTTLAFFFAVLIFSLALWWFYWDGKDYIISTTGDVEMKLEDGHSGHSADAPGKKSSEAH